MPTTRIQLGTFSSNGVPHTFCVYFTLSPQTPPAENASHASTNSPLFRVKDLEALFPQSAIPIEHAVFTNRRGDRYIRARSFAGTTDPILKALCDMSREDYLEGEGDSLLAAIPNLRRIPIIESSSEDILGIGRSPTDAESCTTPREARLESVGAKRAREPLAPMAIKQILASPSESNVHSTQGNEFSSVKREQYENCPPVEASAIVSTPPPSGRAAKTKAPTVEYGAEDAREGSRKRARLQDPASLVAKYPDLLDKVRDAQRLREQQQALIESRQHLEHSHLGASARWPRHRSFKPAPGYRNVRKLSIYAPPNPASSTSPPCDAALRSAPLVGVDRPLLTASFYPPQPPASSVSHGRRGAALPDELSWASAAAASHQSRSLPPRGSQFRPLLSPTDNEDEFKAAFLAPFSALYDFMQEIRALREMLREQIRQSSVMLGLLRPERRPILSGQGATLEEVWRRLDALEELCRV
ncbi:uncharacterized protein VTP21DRAFT_1252 [Calcarisporiella thermophila]|uniref:uncharacterized protein n=1 Tax=Calcarisporiella thermophila TaxID=911321 RepID=UPI003742AF7C